MRTIETKKQNYLKPTMSVCSIVEESFILVASPKVRVSPKTQLQTYTIKHIIS